MYNHKEKILQTSLVKESNLKLYKLSLISNSSIVNEGECDKNKKSVKKFPFINK